MTLHTLKTWLAGDRVNDLAASQFQFAPWITPGLGFLLIAVLAAMTAFLYWPRLKELTLWPRIMIVLLRTLAVSIVIFLLLNPCWEGQIMEPGTQTAALLFDNSKSMRITGPDGRSRGERVLQQLNKTDFVEKLQNKYQVVQYRFGEGMEFIEDAQTLIFNSPSTKMHEALNLAMKEKESRNITSIILFSDGRQQPASAEKSLVNSPIPVYTVDTGKEGEWRDARIDRLAVNRANFDKSPVTLTADLHAQAMAGETLRVDVLHKHRPVKTSTIQVTTSPQTNQVRMEFIPTQKGWVEYALRVTPSNSLKQADITPQPVSAERIVQNNSRNFLIDNREKTFRVLFFSGRPNWEQKFIRRAVEEDEQIQLDSLILLSQAERKFVYRGKKTTTTNPLFEGFEEDVDKYGRYDEPIYLRLGMKENELVHGYPRSATELFSYHLLVWSDVNQELLTSKQFELTKEFVDKRGGSFFLFGGPEMLKRGNLTNTPIVSMLPVHLSQNTQVLNDDPYHVYPSAEGQISGVWSLNPDADANRARWQDMPYLFGLSRFSLPHLGATALARAGLDGQQVPFYLLHRYGKGRSAILAADQTWPWQMQNQEENTAYSRLWRQMIRHLVDPVPSPIQIRGMKDTYIIDRPIPFEILIRDEHFNPMEGGSPKITIQSPAGKSSTLLVEESLTEMGLYSCRFRPAENGLHTLSIKNGEESKITRAFLAVPDHAEFSNPQTNFARLKQIAQTSGGRYYPLAQLKNLANDLPWEPNETAKTLRLPFWHHPIFLFLLIGLLSAEWYLRRRLGQP